MAITELQNSPARGAADRKKDVQASAVPQELPQYDESKLIIVKGRVKVPVKPEPDTERNIQIEKLSAAITKCGDRIAVIKGIKEARRSRAVNPEAAEHKKRKEALNAEWSTVLKQKLLVKEVFQRANTERGVLRDELRELRSKMPRGTKPESLETDIQQLEYKLEHESMPAAEEKKAHQQVSALVAARPAARQILAAEEKLKTVEANRASTKARLDECDAMLEGIKEKERVESAALGEIRKQRDDAGVDMPALEVEKQECWEMIQALRVKITEVREDFNAKWQEWSELNKHYNAWKRHDSYRQFQERQAAREQREAEQNGEAPAPAATPLAETFDSEVFTVDQLLTYLRKFAAPGDAVAKTEQKQVEVPQGLKPFMRKNVEDLSFFDPVAKKVKLGKTPPPAAAAKQDKADPAPAPAVELKKKQRLQHSLDILQTFMALGVEVPLTAAEIPATVDKVEAKKQQLLDKRRRAREAPAPEVQVLPADGDITGHAEQEEPQATGGVTVALAVDAATQELSLKLQM